MIWSFSITLIGDPSLKGAKSKCQGAEPQNIEKVKTKPDATKIQLIGHRQHCKTVIPVIPTTPSHEGWWQEHKEEQDTCVLQQWKQENKWNILSCSRSYTPGNSSVSYGIPWPSKHMEFKVLSSDWPNFFFGMSSWSTSIFPNTNFYIWVLFSTGRIKI